LLSIAARPYTAFQASYTSVSIKDLSLALGFLANSFFERFNRTFCEVVRRMMKDSGMAKK
jgi:hypothetical protein